MNKKSNIDELAKKETDLYNKRSALIFLENAVGNVMQNYGASETRDILNQYIQQLEEF